MHVEEAVKKEISVKKAQASHLKNELVVITELNLNEDDFHQTLDKTGYRIIGFRKEEAKKTLFGWK